MTEKENEAIEESRNALMKTALGIDVDFDINILDTLLNLIQKKQEEIEKKEDVINICRNRLAEKQTTINKLQTLAGLALKGRPLEISKKALNELENTITIEQSENIMNDSYIFRAI